jgi:hypothetical protein
MILKGTRKVLNQSQETKSRNQLKTRTTMKKKKKKTIILSMSRLKIDELKAKKKT